MYPPPRIDKAKLQAAGLRRFRSKHFDLITDLPDEVCAPLVPLVDKLQPFLNSYFGKLPPARNGSTYRVTGYVIDERQGFVEAGVMRADLLSSFHGRQIGAEFWLNNQTFDYYRRHLLLHEAVHAYMRHIPGEQQFPLWYLEGMAEMIATHSTDEATGEMQFNVMPADRRLFRGFERIEVIKRDVRVNGVKSFGSIISYVPADFRESLEPYAWCWALCRFLDSHPRYQAPFRRLARTLSQGRFKQQLDEGLGVFGHELETEFALFAAGIEHAYDFKRAAVTFNKAQLLADKPGTIELRSDLGWQSSGMRLAKGQTCLIAATGQFTLADEPKPWVSEANGVSIRYYGGQRLGRLLAAIHTDGKVGAGNTMLQSTPLGNEASFTAPAAGTLYLRLNDAWNELADNHGSVRVTISRPEQKAESGK